MASLTTNPTTTGPLANRPPGAQTLRIEPPRTWFELRLDELWKYRETVLARIKQTKAWKAVQATSLYKWYYSYDKLYG